MRDEVYIVIENYSPDLQVDCGIYYVWGIYRNRQDAVDAVKKLVAGDADDGFLPREQSDEYALVYKDGDENSALWSEYRVEKYSLL